MSDDFEFDLLCERRRAIGRTWLWPRADEFGWSFPLRYNIPDLKNRREQHPLLFRGVALQAGGCCGMVPWLLSHWFDAIYTFEPDALNFFCLVNNTQGRNIHCFNAALSNRSAFASTHGREDRNCGAGRLAERRTDPERGNHSHNFVPGSIPVLQGDSLAFPRLDAIFLDVEEGEEAILEGLEKSIEICRTKLIVVETLTSSLEKKLKNFGFVNQGRSGENSDWFFTRETS